MTDHPEAESNIVQFPKTTEEPQKKRSLFFGLVFGLFVFLIYIFRSEFFPKTETTVQSQQQLTLFDINFTPFMSNQSLPMGKLKFYTRNKDGGWKIEEKSLRDFSGKPLIVHLWATYCGPCVKELPMYDQFVESAGSHIENIALVVGKVDPKEIETFYKQKGIKNLKIVIDENNVLVSAFKFQGIPTSMLVSASGKPLGYISGLINWDDTSVVSLITTVLKKQ